MKVEMFEQKTGLMKILVCSVNWVLVVLKRNLNTIRYSKVIYFTAMLFQIKKDLIRMPEEPNLQMIGTEKSKDLREEDFLRHSHFSLFLS